MDCQNQMVIDFNQDYRNSEPTSKLADEAITKSGLKASQCQEIYMVIRSSINGGTSREIAAKGDMRNEIVHKRLSTPKDNGWLQEGKPRKCKITGRLAKTWFLI